MAIVITGGAKVDKAGVETLHGALIPWDSKVASSSGSWVSGLKGRTFFDTPPARFGRMDAFSKLTVGCAHLALKDAAAAGSESFPEGIVLGSLMGCLMTDIQYYAPVCDKGPEHAGPLLFSYTLPNVAVGEVCREFRLFGPNTVISCGEDSALAALVVAHGWLSSGRASALLAGGVEAVDSRVAELCRGDSNADIRSSAFLFQLERQDEPWQPGLPTILGGESEFSPSGFSIERSVDLGNTGMERMWHMLNMGGRGFRAIDVRDKEGYSSSLKVFIDTEKHGSTTRHRTQIKSAAD
ncbi:MAG: hypothetical protein HY788_15720 [Deltaproteobacteria bacterium]|nr:hypothetical protein [Deltaproteobacteria bacterium]